MSSTISKAAAATGEVQEHVGRAIEILRSGFNGRIVNGHGIYSDPSQRRADLRAAQEAISSALKVMTDTSWPTAADYDADEAEAWEGDR